MNWYERATVRLASTRAGAWFFVNVAMRIDRVLVPLTAGRLSSCLGTRYHRRHLLLLTTTGAKSGRPRTVPLLYFADGADLVVIGSKGGHPRHPAWYHNVRAHPQVTVYARGTRGEYQAREAHGAERARLREIPVVVLSAG